MKYGALIIETRPIPNLVEIIRERHLNYLPDDWGLMIVCSEQNMAELMKAFPDAEIFTSRVNSLSEYNRMLTNDSFWNEVPFDKVLVFQSDSRLLRKGIERFLQYDYVGAPWKFQNHGGNGGLSLRSKRAMLDTIHQFPFNESQHGNEDVYFSNHLQKAGWNLAPREVCMEFSVETIYHPKPLGIHAAEKYLSKDQLQTILSTAE